MNVEHLHYYPSVDERLCIQRNVLSLIITDLLEIESPQRHGHEDEKRIVGDVVSDARAFPKPVRDVSLSPRLCRSGCNLAVRIEEPPRIKPRSVVTIDRRVMVTLPKIRNACCPLWDEHSIVPIVLRRAMRNRKWERRSPSENFFDRRLYIREA